MYRFLHSGPLYLSLHLDKSVYNTHKGHDGGVLIEVPHFATSVYKSSKHFGLSYAYNAQKSWSDLSDDVCSAASLLIQKEAQTYLFAQAYPP